MSKKAETKCCEIYLGYFKRGDDLHACLEYEKDNIRALRAHAVMMRFVAEQLESIASVLSDYPDAKVEINADTHHIDLTGPAEVVDSLVEKELAEIPDWLKEEEFEGDFDENDGDCDERIRC